MVALRPATPEAYDLLHRGTITFARMEAAGFRVNEDFLEKAIRRVTKKINRLTEELRDDKIYGVWQKAYGSRLNLNAGKQLAHVIYNILGLPVRLHTESGEPSTSEDVLGTYNLPFLQSYLHIKKLEKVLGTYLKGIQRETINGFVHAVYNLHLVSSYRSSCDSPNLQNTPSRNEEMMRLVRGAFIARKDHQIVELDFKAIEVCIAACYHKDPNMLAYINDPTKDMHRDMAARCFMLSTKQVSKMCRYVGKNCFVFPNFYGSYFRLTAPDLWEALTRLNVKIEGTDISVKDHLKSKGIRKLGACDPQQKPIPGTFEYHIQKVEYDFWNKDFPVYAEWKNEWWEKYKKNKGFHTKTGFTVEAPLVRNQAINIPIQGSAFHCNLHFLNEMVEKLHQQKMRSKIIGQVHDSGIGDVHKNELEDFKRYAKRIIKHLPEHWDWIITPLSVEAQVAPVGGSWVDKEEVDF